MRKLFPLLLLVLLAFDARAQLEIEIVQGNASQLPIAIVPFQWRSASPPPVTTVSEVVSNDLYRSGLFAPVDEADMVDRPADAESIRFGTWRLLKVDYLVIGWVNDAPGGGYDIVYQLFDVNTQERLLSQITSVGPGDLRFGAHRVADAIYEALTGVPGAFSTRIAYVSATGEGAGLRYELVVADADGFSPITVVGSPEPLLSPAWSPDGERLAYVSFEKGNSAIYVQEVTTGAGALVSSGTGLSGAPACSPVGRDLAGPVWGTGTPGLYGRALTAGRTAPRIFRRLGRTASTSAFRLRRRFRPGIRCASRTRTSFTAPITGARTGTSSIRTTPASWATTRGS